MHLLTCLLFLTLVLNVVPEKCALGNDINEFIQCASVKSLKTLQRAQNEDLLLAPGVALKANGGFRAPKSLNLDLPTNNTSKLLDMLISESLRFISDRTLKVEVPLNSTSVARAFEEGRGKMKKMMNPLILGIGAKMMTMVPLLFGGVLFLATKALLIGKVALVISALLFIQFFFNFNSRGFFNNGGGTFSIPPTYGGGPTYGVPTTYGTNFGTNSVGGWGNGPYRRSMTSDDSEVK